MNELAEFDFEDKSMVGHLTARAGKYLKADESQYYLYGVYADAPYESVLREVDIDQLPPEVREAALNGEKIHWHIIEDGESYFGRPRDVFCIPPASSHLYDSKGPVKPPAPRVEKIKTDLL